MNLFLISLTRRLPDLPDSLRSLNLVFFVKATRRGPHHSFEKKVGVNAPSSSVQFLGSISKRDFFILTEDFSDDNFKAVIFKEQKESISLHYS